MSSDPVIVIEGVGKQYATRQAPGRRLLQVLFGLRQRERDSFHALKDVSFRVERGETLGIIGRNGAGKSTLLQIICGTLTPSSGSVRVKGRVAALLELGAGFNPEFTGRENVYMNAAIHGLDRSAVDARMADILAFAEIGHFIDQPVKTYSSGMFVRLAFAVIAHLDADILVIDEALAVGDVYFTQKCMRFLREFSERGTLLFVSHDTNSVVGLCRRAVWLDSGRVRMVGLAKEISNGYLGSFYEDRLNQLEGTDQKAAEEELSAARAEFGLGEGRIESCELLCADGAPLRVLDEAQDVTLRVHCRAIEAIEKPIVGFYIKDRLGQPICGTNTFQRLAEFERFFPGDRVAVSFRFHLPLLATGEYTITAALAAGTQQEHVQHHWIHDALAFKAKADPHLSGLFTLENLHCEVATR